MKKLLTAGMTLSLSALLAACGPGGGETPTPESTLNVNKISGAVSGTTFVLGNAYLGSVNSNFFGKTVLTNNAVNFDLSKLMPGGIDTPTGEFVEGCAGTHSNPAVRTLSSSSLSVYSPQGDFLGEITETVTGGGDASLVKPRIIRLYAEQPFTFKGTCSFKTPSGTTINETVNVTASQGWNAIVVSGSGTQYDLKNAAADDKVQLTFVGATQAVGIFPDADSIVFSDDADVSVPVSFIQVGGYTGTVTLSTDYPGLSVTPASVTLPALPKISGQTLGKQSVDTVLKFKYSGTDNPSNKTFNLLAKDASGQLVGSKSLTLNVLRPGFNLLSSYPEVEIARGQTIGVSFDLMSVKNFTAAVTVSAEDLPAGVSVTPTTVNLTGSNSGAVKLTASASAAPGLYTIKLVGSGGGRTGSVPVTVRVLQPSVLVGFENPWMTQSVAQGENGFVKVVLTSSNGFSGKTTVSLTGLPNGVTSSAVTVDVSPTAAATVNLPLNAAANATLGDFKVKVTTPDTTTPPEFTLRVLPARTLLPASPTTMGASSVGTWLSFPVAEPQITRSTMTHYVGGVATQTINVDDFVSRILSMPGGDVYADGGWYSKLAQRVQPDGKVIALKSPIINVDKVAADSTGSLWYHTDLSLQGQGKLNVWNTVSGVNKVADATPGRWAGGSWASSPDQKTLLWVTPNIIKIDTLTGTVTPLNAASSAYQGGAAINNAGEVWLVKTEGLSTIDSAGVIKSYSTITPKEMIGFDAVAPDTLWAYDGTSILKINTKAITAVSYPVGNVSKFVTNQTGGVSYVGEEYSAGTTRYYLSSLK